MSAATAPAKVRVAEKRYVLQTKSLQGWWPWGSLCIACLVLLYLYGATLAAPQAFAELRREFVDWLEVAEQPQNVLGNNAANGLRSTETKTAAATDADPEVSVESKILNEPGQTAGAQGIEKEQL